LINLDEKQKEIVMCEDNKIVVVAAAGSGKTRVLTERIKRLLSDGVEPASIIAITFTNMAADEMRERLSEVENSGDVFIGTIHSFANKILRKSGYDYSLLTQQKENDYAEHLLRNYGSHLTFERYLKYKDAEYLYNSGRLSEREFIGFLLPSEKAEFDIITGKKPKDKFRHTIYTLGKENGVITFTELIEKATEYFSSAGVSIEHVLVDEFQDVGYPQFEFVMALNANNYFIVGDDWQSIYSFNGGDVAMLLGLIKNDIWTKFYMDKNYRSGKKIIRMANDVIEDLLRAGDDSIIRKKVKAISEETGTVNIKTRHKLKESLLMIDSLGNYKDWFILTRSNKDLFHISNELEDLNIPHTTFKKSDLTLDEMRLLMAANTIKVLTVHTAKGLENKNVILYGNFPLTCKINLEYSEERRIMYVGMTRAEETLLILN
jgi:Superfamily I DNA and RNA helicases